MKPGPEKKTTLPLKFSKKTITKLSAIDLKKIQGGCSEVKVETLRACGTARSTCGTIGC
jgi:hypothetical protein